MRKGLLAITALLFLVITCCSSSGEETKPETQKKRLTLMTYNIRHGAPYNSDVINLNNIAAVIKKSNADIVALQEVDVNTTRSANVADQIDQIKKLAELLDMEYYFSKSIDYKGGEYGNAILSKYPLSNKRRFDLPAIVGGEQRSIALATVTLPDGKTMEFGSTHFDLNTIRVAQAQFLNDISEQLKKPLFIGGDFNATPDSEEMTLLKKGFNFSCMGNCQFTIPVVNPTKAIDFIVYNPLAKQTYSLLSAIAMTGQYASDHLPVVAIYQYD
ncbi:Metal-dependent hydrolase, endonuclease/exonuclease/phosphatase family [Sphingobacterium nematocida]|uniref:Metal-dependent hydrolase, endonuclease/exonuclease/phosphatase family n=1 Tax=Sphingobacterium nematocida TaxID=1513896 RepID=A0A1T5EWN9_9SPHI|nr:endonuclease/exonuclease/phosphatase family protein [Sphingobacterium nematocida]SKB88365.1 Metal-dependent hydrolase, endonuclease/exonuclease/phosphatase family [Sphingobacterium nematocida]